MSAHGLTSTRGEGAALGGNARGAQTTDERDRQIAQGGHAGRTVDASHAPPSLRGAAAPEPPNPRACLIHASAAAFSAARSAPAMM
jgi:hypothetical protein